MYMMSIRSRVFNFLSISVGRKIFSSRFRLLSKKFWKNHLKLNDFFHFCFLRLAECSFKSQLLIIGHSKHTRARIIKLVRRLINFTIEEEKLKIGGVGIEVQFDEYKFGKRKYDRRLRRFEGTMVFWIEEW